MFKNLIYLGGVIAGVVVLLILVIYFYRKYIYTKKVLNYEINDVRNLATRDVSELRDMSTVVGRRYENLAEDPSVNLSQI